jgi:hypothetical protein
MAARTTPAPSSSPAAPTPIATIDSHKAMMMIKPWRSTKCPACTRKPETPRKSATP